ATATSPAARPAPPCSTTRSRSRPTAPSPSTAASRSPRAPARPHPEQRKRAASPREDAALPVPRRALQRAEEQEQVVALGRGRAVERVARRCALTVVRLDGRRLVRGARVVQQAVAEADAPQRRRPHAAGDRPRAAG